jgi:hypothetical protein
MIFCCVLGVDYSDGDEGKADLFTLFEFICGMVKSRVRCSALWRI